MFKNARDVSQVANIICQIYPGKSAFMVEVIKTTTSVP